MQFKEKLKIQLEGFCLTTFLYLKVAIFCLYGPKGYLNFFFQKFRSSVFVKVY